ncbi:uncharacterized protein LOC141628319 [Silene latifolia]|uniref:uncharacterized protein LOC141628319 n=1 Tax=Silene latifolia TaxID=37657 RepID=UPI003D7728D2
MFAYLIAKVQTVLNHWSTYKLSYAGKVSLINSVIFGLEQYWCSTLLIPKGVLKLITKFCRRFLWDSEDSHRKLIMKSWDSCCAPYTEGGFNIKEILAWNKCIISAERLLSGSVKKGCIQLSLLYDKFRMKSHPISWGAAVWHRAVLPKHSVFLMLAMQQNLATIDKLNHRGISLVNRCVLCKADNETHKHLFFKCIFSDAIWHKVLHWLRIQHRTSKLSKEMHWIAGKKVRKHWKAQWFSSCLGATVYSLWEERNIRIFHGLEHDIEYVVKRIQYFVSKRLLFVNSPSKEGEIIGSLNA